MHLREMRRYHRGDPHSYALGTFCVLELLSRRPEQALRVVLEPDAVDSPGGLLVRRAADRAGVALDVDARVPGALGRKGNVHAVAAFAKFDAPPDPDADHVVLVRPADFGNLGTIVRTMRGLGVSDLLVVPPAADLFDPQVVRASMGALFGLRWAEVADLSAYLSTYAEGSRRTLVAFRSDGAVPLGSEGFARPATLVFGPESSGLLPGDLPAGVAMTAVAIPQDPAIDSFNLAVSVAIGLWELRRQPGKDRCSPAPSAGRPTS